MSFSGHIASLRMYHVHVSCVVASCACTIMCYLYLSEPSDLFCIFVFKKTFEPPRCKFVTVSGEDVPWSASNSSAN